MQEGKIKTLKQNITAVAAALIFLAALVPYVYLSIYSRPCADDYAYSRYTHTAVQDKSGFFGVMDAACRTVKRFYYGWQGTYSSSFIMSLQPGIFGEKYYCIGALSLICIEYLSLLFFLYTLKKHLLPRLRYIPVFSLGFLLALLCGLPDICQGLYWFNGTWHYMPFFFFTLVNVTLCLRAFFADKQKGRILYLCLGAVLSLIISGGDQVMAFFNILLLVVLAVVFAVKRRPDLSLPFVSALSGFIVMWTAPGNAIRQAEYVKHQELIKTVTESLDYCLECIGKWVNAEWLILMALCLVTAGYFLMSAPKEKPVKLNPVFTLSISFIVLTGLFCVPYYGMGEFGEGRLLNVVWLAFLSLSVFNLFYILNWLNGKSEALARISEALRLPEAVKQPALALAALALSLSLCCFAGSNTHKLVSDIQSGAAKSYAEACDVRFERVRQAKKGEIVVTEPLPPCGSIKFGDVGANMLNWKNIAWYRYYGVRILLNADSIYAKTTAFASSLS